MGLVLKAQCEACGYGRENLILGGTHEQIEAHDVSAYEIFAVPCCGELQSVKVFMGQEYPELPCAYCEAALELSQDTRYRISTLKGEVFTGHRCPQCMEARLRFVPTDNFV